MYGTNIEITTKARLDNKIMQCRYYAMQYALRQIEL